MSLSRKPGIPSGSPDIEDVLAALRSIYPEDRFVIEHRAVAVEAESQMVFEVYPREGVESDAPREPKGSSDQGWPF